MVCKGVNQSCKKEKIVGSFSVNGKVGEKIQVIFRYPKKSDVRAAVRLVNCIRRETMYLSRARAETLKSEAAWLEKQVKHMKQGKGLLLFVEVEGNLVGNSSIRPLEADSSRHIGEFGIMLREKFTGIGIGTRLLRKMLDLAKKETRFKIIESNYFSKNKRSAALHKKLGFKEFGRFPKGCALKGGGYCGKVYVYKQIEIL